MGLHYSFLALAAEQAGVDTPTLYAKFLKFFDLVFLLNFFLLGVSVYYVASMADHTRATPVLLTQIFGIN